MPLLLIIALVICIIHNDSLYINICQCVFS
nr:MAG TPA: hypothetical protein [Caudoviricetes sp.]